MNAHTHSSRMKPTYRFLEAGEAVDADTDQYYDPADERWHASGAYGVIVRQARAYRRPVPEFLHRPKRTPANGDPRR